MLKLTKRQKEMGIGIFVIAFYFIYSKYLSYLPLAIFDIDLSSGPMFLRIAYFVAADIFLIAIFLAIFHKTIEKDFKDFKKNASSYFDLGIKYWITGVIAMGVSSVIINYFLQGGVAQNEQAVREMIQIVPYYMLFSTAIYAPIIEELTFRKAFCNILGKNMLFVILSGVVFGGMHVIFSATSFVDYLQIIPYSSVGIALAYMYYKTNNILVPMSMHFIHNFTFTLLIMVLGL